MFVSLKRKCMWVYIYRQTHTPITVVKGKYTYAHSDSLLTHSPVDKPHETACEWLLQYYTAPLCPHFSCMSTLTTYTLMTPCVFSAPEVLHVPPLKPQPSVLYWFFSPKYFLSISPSTLFFCFTREPFPAEVAEGFLSSQCSQNVPGQTFFECVCDLVYQIGCWLKSNNNKKSAYVQGWLQDGDMQSLFFKSFVCSKVRWDINSLTKQNGDAYFNRSKCKSLKPWGFKIDSYNTFTAHLVLMWTHFIAHTNFFITETFSPQCVGEQSQNNEKHLTALMLWLHSVRSLYCLSLNVLGKSTAKTGQSWKHSSIFM